tara:strand:- start:315 stop:512 length:198 start_codon:yes stop_codon:yes gene_type:complete
VEVIVLVIVQHVHQIILGIVIVRMIVLVLVLSGVEKSMDGVLLMSVQLVQKGIRGIVMQRVIVKR